MKPKYWAVVILTVLAILCISLYYWNNHNESNLANRAYPNNFIDSPNYPINQLLVSEAEGSISTSTAESVAKYVGGSVQQCIEGILCEIQVSAQSDAELTSLINKIKSNPSFSSIKVMHNARVTPQ